MISIGVHNRRILKNLVTGIGRLNQPVCYEATLSTRYPDYYLVYQFPYIRTASLINRIKFFQTGMTGLGLPLGYGAAYFDLMTTDEALLYFVTGLAACSILYTAGFFGQNRIGFVYLKKDNSDVKIAYTNIWGRRVDVDVPLQDIVPLSECPVTFTHSLYYSFRRYSTNKTLKFSTAFGGILDSEKFKYIFGQLK